MSSWTKETSGMEVLRRISKEALKDKSCSARVWNEELNCWGFFCKDKTDKNMDNFLLWCSVVPGDRIFLEGSWSEKSKIEGGFYTVLAVWKDTIAKNPTWKMRLISRDALLFDSEILERNLFEAAMKASGIR